MNRRRFLLALIAASTGAALLRLFRGARSHGPGARELLAHHLEGLDGAGRASFAARVAGLPAHLGAAERRALIAADFAAGRVSSVGGWLLSETELACLARG